MNTRLTELLGIEYPVIQGGMAWVATAELAAAVSEAGGLGLIAAGGAPADIVREEIRKALTIYGYQLVVNFLWPTFFFNFGWYFFSFLWLVLLWVLVLIMILRFKDISKVAAYMNIPYLIWLTFAGYLNLGIWLLNR